MEPSGTDESELEMSRLHGQDPGCPAWVFNPQFPCLEIRQRIQDLDNLGKPLPSLRTEVEECAQGHPAGVETRLGP